MLPERFLLRMETMLGADYPQFLREITAEKSVRALRVNSLKTTADTVAAALPFPLSPLPYAENGYIFDAEHIGSLAAHHAGMIYVQDPSAMATVAAVALPEDATVLDLCAAPGGKTSQIAARIPSGVIIANEYNPTRCKALVGNLERLGVRNAVVTNMDGNRLARMYEGVFDLVLLDAPCSGEGMLRKYAVAAEEWSEENVTMCAARQAELLDSAAGAVKAGGYLLYSTCTFSVEENEANVAAFLSRHPAFSLVPVADALVQHTASGIPVTGSDADMTLARRFYPHIAAGEGQFIALLQRNRDGEVRPRFAYTGAEETRADREVRRVTEEFLRENFEGLDLSMLRVIGEKPILFPSDFPVPREKVFMAGVLCGEAKNGRLLPHHQLFSAYGGYMKRRLSLDTDAVYRYLAGEEIPTDLSAGWAAVLYVGAPLGGAKISGGMAKNHYPKGLRLHR